MSDKISPSYLNLIKNKNPENNARYLRLYDCYDLIDHKAEKLKIDSLNDYSWVYNESIFKLPEIYELHQEFEKEVNRILGENPSITLSDDSKQPSDWNSSTTNGIEIKIGKAKDKDFFFQLGDEYSAYHGIVTGKTGSGKSVLLHQLIINGAMKYSPNELEFILLDLKDGVEFQFYENLPHVKILGIDEDPAFGYEVLKWIDDEYTRRSTAFKSKQVKNIEEYKLSGEHLSRIIVVIDEFQKMFTHREIGSEAELMFGNFVRQLRSVGIHLVLATQTPNGVKWQDSTLEQIALRMGPMMSREAEESLFQHGSELIAANFTQKGDAIYNSHSGIKSETQTFNYGYVDPKLLNEDFLEYYKNAQEIGWEDSRVIYRKSDCHLRDFSDVNIDSTTSDVVGVELGYYADVTRDLCKIKLFDARKRSANFLVLGDSDSSLIVKNDLLIATIHDYLISSDSSANVFFYSEYMEDYNSFNNFLGNLNVQITNDPEELATKINDLYDKTIPRTNGNRELLIIDGINYLDEINDYSDSTSGDDEWGTDSFASDNKSNLEKLNIIIDKSRINGNSIVLYAQKRSLFNEIFNQSLFSRFTYALALKGGDNKVNDVVWDNHKLDENIGYLYDSHNKTLKKINLLKIKI